MISQLLKEMPLSTENTMDLYLSLMMSHFIDTQWYPETVPGHELVG